MAQILAYLQAGNTESSTTLVFIHGSTMTKELMLPVAEKFPKYNCIAVDLPAHGQSEGPAPADVEACAEAVEATISHLQNEGVATKNVIIMGYSLGGAIVAEIAIRKKIDLKGIVFLSSCANMDKYTPLVDGLKGMPVEDFHTADIVDYLFGPDTPEEAKAFTTENFLKYGAPEPVGYNDLIIANKYSRLEDIRGLQLPAMIIHGNDDQIILPMAAVGLWNALPNSELLMLPYRGHSAIFDDGDVVAEKINSFIKRIQ